MSDAAVFQSVLRRLSAMPPEDWVVVESLLAKMAVKNQPIGKDPKGILQFAGSWAAWDDDEFCAFLSDLQN